MNFTIEQVRECLYKIGLIRPENLMEISFAKFKNTATIHKYGSGRNQLKIVFCGIPKEALIGFYVMSDTDPNVLREAYNWYKRLVKGDLGPMEEGDVIIGNSGFPHQYGEIRWVGKK